MNKIIILLYLLLIELTSIPITILLITDKANSQFYSFILGISSLVTLAIIFYLYLSDYKKLMQLAKLQQQLLATAGNSSDDLISKLEHNQNQLIADFASLQSGQKDLIQAISHELKTPLTRLHFRLESLEPQLEQAPEFLGIKKDITELEQLIEELLTFHKLNAQTQANNLQPQPIEPIIQQVITSAELIYPQQKISYQIEPQTDLKLTMEPQLLTMEPQLIKRALQNLTLNALKYANSKVEIKVIITSNSYQITVADDGLGVAAKHRQAIFTPFYRIDNSRTKNTGGHGLGLAIVAQIAKYHNGQITIGNSQLGGAKFTIQWPKTR